MSLAKSDVSDEEIPEEMLSQKMTPSPQDRSLKNMTVGQLLEHVQGPFSGMFKSIVSGKYQYLTYLMCSTACFFFWMAPNNHKLQLIRPVRRRMRPSSRYGSVTVPLHDLSQETVAQSKRVSKGG